MMLGTLLGIAALAALLFFPWRTQRRPRPRQPVPDGPEDEPYRVFTDEFDWIVSAEDLPQRMRSESPDIAKGWTDQSEESWQQAIGLAAVARAAAGDHARLVDLVKEKASVAPGPVAVTFLVDQSGSLKGEPMVAVQAALEAALVALEQMGPKTEILGFSTVGWQGGRARQLWHDIGRPARPGRLCALLHIVYKAADQPAWSEGARDVMLHPDILRENVDGEAIRWAAGRLRDHAAGTKLLIVLSDGAPVDDSTLLENGPRYLEKDILRAIAEVEAAGDICLGAVGLGHDVDRYYARSLKSDWPDLPDALVTLLLDMLGEARTKS